MYDCICDACGPVEVFARVKDVDKLACCNCGKPVKQDYAAKFATLGVKQDSLDTRPTGQQEVHGRLLDYDCSPAEAKQRRESLAEHGLAHMYTKEGKCIASSRSEMRKFAKVRGDMLRRKEAGEKDAKKTGW
jgi:hypothetical protein